MTEDTTPTGAQNLQLQVATGVVPGPDGQPWVALSLQYGFTKFDFVLPEALAAQVGPAVTAKLAEALAQARRTRLGIILPGDQTPGLPSNGGQVPLPRLPGIAG